MSSATVPDLLGLPAKELFSITAIGYRSLTLSRTLAFSCRYVRIIKRPSRHEGEANPSTAVRTMGTDTTAFKSQICYLPLLTSSQTGSTFRLSQSPHVKS